MAILQRCVSNLGRAVIQSLVLDNTFEAKLHKQNDQLSEDNVRMYVCMYICTYTCIPDTVVVILCTSLQLLIIIAQSYGTDPSKLYYNNMEGYGLAHRLKGNLIVLFHCGSSAGVTCNSSQLIGDTDSSNSNAALKG